MFLRFTHVVACGRIRGDFNFLLGVFLYFQKSSSGNMCYISHQKSHRVMARMCLKENNDQNTIWPGNSISRDRNLAKVRETQTQLCIKIFWLYEWKPRNTCNVPKEEVTQYIKTHPYGRKPAGINRQGTGWLDVESGICFQVIQEGWM